MSLRAPPWLATVQSCCSRYFVDILDVQTHAYSSENLALKVTSFIERMCVDQLSINLDKFVMIRKIINHPAINKKDTLCTCLPVIVRQLKTHIGRTVEEQIFCVYILGEILCFLQNMENERISEAVKAAATDLGEIPEEKTSPTSPVPVNPPPPPPASLSADGETGEMEPPLPPSIPPPPVGSLLSGPMFQPPPPPPRPESPSTTGNLSSRNAIQRSQGG
eukprot:126_1